MKRRITFNRLNRKWLMAALPCFLYVSLASNSYAQTPVYATTAFGQSSTTGTGSVTNPGYASDGDLSTAAEVHVSTIALGATKYVEFGYPDGTYIPEGKTLYIPMHDDGTGTSDILKTLLTGTLADLVGDLLSDEHIEVAIKNGTSNVVTYSTQGNGNRNFTQGKFNVVQDKTGQMYITFKAAPGVQYNRIRVSAVVSGLGLLTSFSTYVQDAYYIDGVDDPCSPFVTTSIDATGITAGVLNSNGDPVQNPQNAIDDDTTTYSQFGYGLATVGVGSQFSQDFYFSSLSNPGDQLKMKVFFPSNLLVAGVLNTITISGYRNDSLISSSSLSSLLDLQLLQLITLKLGNNIPVDIQIPIGNDTERFDRVRVSYTQLVDATLDQYLRIYSIDRVPAMPVVAVPTGESCPGTDMRLSITNVRPDVDYKWYDNNGTVVSTDTFYDITVPSNGDSVMYYVTSNSTICIGKESVPTIAKVIGDNSNCVEFSAVAFLGGAYDSTAQRNKDVTSIWATVLAANATSQPYNVAPFSYSGTETVDPSVFTSSSLATNDVVDWVLLELKDSAGNLVDRKAVLLLENGEVTNLDKTQPVAMKALAGKYSLTVRHRNHFGLSTNVNDYAAGNNVFNFTTATDADLYGDANAYMIVNGKTVLIPGDANSNGSIRYNSTANDKDAVLMFLGGDAGGTSFNVYTPTDLNLDGVVRFNGTDADRDVILRTLNGNEGATKFQEIQ